MPLRLFHAPHAPERDEPDKWTRFEIPDRRQRACQLLGGRRAADQYPPGKAPRSACDRRREPRYIPSARGAFLGWREGETFQTAVARTENLSRSGAALLVDYAPPGERGVWISLSAGDSGNWYEARVVGASPTGGVGRIVRIALREPLPYDVFKAIVWGLPTDDTPQSPA